jgi:hypothetical protein
MVIDPRLLHSVHHSAKAKSPIEVTEPGMMTAPRLLQP